MMRSLVSINGVGNDKVGYDDIWVGTYIQIQSQVAGVLGNRRIDRYTM
jgi:hypothetical protein